MKVVSTRSFLAIIVVLSSLFNRFTAKSLLTRKPTTVANVTATEPRRHLMCRCDACRESNYTCITSGACLMQVKRLPDGSIKERRTCTQHDEGFRHTLQCSYYKPNLDLRVKCCYHNMCNVDDIISLDTQQPAHDPSRINRFTAKSLLHVPRKPAAVANVTGNVRHLVCQCDKCRKMNYTCMTSTRNGACFVLLWREQPGNEIRKFRRCATGRPGQSIAQMCKKRAYRRNVRHCCFENMCNVDADVDVPTWEPLAVIHRPATATEPRRHLMCRCDACRESNYTCITSGACLMQVKRLPDGSIKERRTCTQHDEGFRHTLQCSYYKPNLDLRVKCCYHNMCNVDDIISLDTQQPAHDASPSGVYAKTADLLTKHLALILSGASVVALVISIGVAVVCCYRRCLTHTLSDDKVNSGDIPEGKTLRDVLTHVYVGSGSGPSVLQQRTIAQQVELCNEVGRGRYGQVFRGIWRGEEVAVKIFASVQEKSWHSEVGIYQRVMLRHKNILGFIAADREDDGLATQLWLITEYHGNGCLSDFLCRESLDATAVLRVAASVASGLAHLHADIVGTMGKPEIAHRDLKSKNILVKEDGTCCIADLGLAICKNASDDHPLVGTTRYLAPEFLDGSYDKTRCFNAYKHRDIYALGLVFWEVARRCNTSEGIDEFEYQMPYYDKVPSDPSLEDMKPVVCNEAYRPPIPGSWEGNKVLCAMAGVMKDCWHPHSEARLTALRTKKTLLSLLPKKC